jgi:hypothetical protein
VAHAQELLQEEEEVKASDRGTAGTGRKILQGGATEEGHCQSWSCKSLCKTILVRQKETRRLKL